MIFWYAFLLLHSLHVSRHAGVRRLRFERLPLVVAGHIISAAKTGAGRSTHPSRASDTQPSPTIHLFRESLTCGWPLFLLSWTASTARNAPSPSCWNAWLVTITAQSISMRNVPTTFRSPAANCWTPANPAASFGTKFLRFPGRISSSLWVGCLQMAFFDGGTASSAAFRSTLSSLPELIV